MELTFFERKLKRIVRITDITMVILLNNRLRNHTYYHGDIAKYIENIFQVFFYKKFMFCRDE